MSNILEDENNMINAPIIDATKAREMTNKILEDKKKKQVKIKIEKEKKDVAVYNEMVKIFNKKLQEAIDNCEYKVEMVTANEFVEKDKDGNLKPCALSSFIDNLKNIGYAVSYNENIILKVFFLKISWDSQEKITS